MESLTSLKSKKTVHRFLLGHAKATVIITDMDVDYLNVLHFKICCFKISKIFARALLKWKFLKIIFQNLKMYLRATVYEKK